MRCKRSLLILIICGIGATSLFAQQDLTALVNPLMGTQSSHALSNGNTYPAIARPWGMNFWSPQTGMMGDGWMYTYNADKIRGFKQTHQPSPWMNDYGQFSIMPVTGRMVFREKERASWFSHKAEEVHPYFYSVYLADHDVTASLTATERAAFFQFKFPASDTSCIVIDAFDKGSYVKIIPEKKQVVGYTTKNSGGVPGNFKNYFVLEFNKPFDEAHPWHDSVMVMQGSELQHNHAGAILRFKTSAKEIIEVKVASSFISEEQAMQNLRAEIGNDNFETTLTKSKAAWNKVLQTVAIEGGSLDDRRTFYSCLYRAVCFPQKMYEVLPGGSIAHYSPYNGKVVPGRMFAGTGFWDTFRALYPLLNLLYPSINAEMQEGLVNCWKEGGFLPEWSSPGFRSVMVGNNSASVVADAYVKGLRGYDINELYKALIHGANNEGPLDAVGRKGVEFYNTLGYVPYDAGINENAARTLEYAYDDFAIWKLGKALNRPQSELAVYERRMMNYKNLFDPQTRLMRGKNKDGSFQKNFSPFKWGDAFTEGNSWHYSWSVFHDIAGLMQLMGGRKTFVSMLDSVFNMPPVFDESYYGFVIHEIREMQIMNMGQYAHGNQPIQHMVYLYNYAGEPWKTQQRVRQVMNTLYKPTPDGYCGDEDNGQTSAWYIFSALGFYPVCPATTQYVAGIPLFPSATLHFENGKILTIKAPQSASNLGYIQQLNWNGRLYSKNYFEHNDLLRGGEMSFKLSSTPNRQRGIMATDVPYSYSLHK